MNINNQIEITDRAQMPHPISAQILLQGNTQVNEREGIVGLTNGPPNSQLAV
jgi:hypothetical protein